MRKLLFLGLTILLAVASCTKKSAPTSSQPAIDAAPLFSQNCARCHGATGVEGRAPNLAKTEHTKNEIADIITNGAGRMPSFSDKLSAPQIDALAAYVLHLKK